MHRGCALCVRYMDQVTLKVAYTVEANEELMKYMDSKAQFVTLAGSNGRLAGAEAIQAIYNLTLVLKADKSKVTPSSQITFA